MKWSDDTFQNKRRRTTDNAETTDDPTAFAEQWAMFGESLQDTLVADHDNKSQHSDVMSRFGGASGQDGMTQDRKQQATEACKKAISVVRKTHSTWDRMSRDWKSAIAKSSKNSNTCGSKIEKSLEATLQECVGCDDRLQQLEQLYLEAGSLEPDEIDASAEIVTKMDEGIKAGSKLATALKSWFKL